MSGCVCKLLHSFMSSLSPAFFAQTGQTGLASSVFMWPQPCLIFANLKLAMGLTASPLISLTRNWTCLFCLSNDGPLIGVGWVHALGRGMPWCGSWQLQDTAMRRKKKQDPVMVGGVGKMIIDLAAGHLDIVVPIKCVSSFVHMALHCHQEAHQHPNLFTPSLCTSPRLTVLNSYVDHLSESISADNQRASQMRCCTPNSCVHWLADGDVRKLCG